MTYIYLDRGGEGPGLVPADQAQLSADDRGFLFGDGLFETMLARDGQVPLLTLHLWRLSESAAALSIPADPDSFSAAVLAVAEAAGQGEHAVRLTLSRGTQAGRGYTPPAEPAPTLLITAAPYRRPPNPISLITSSVRVCAESLTARHKSLSGLDKVMARAEARAAGAGEALMLNTAGRVAEGAAANLFIRRGGLWLTPPVTEGALPGVMRRRLIAVTQAREEPLRPSDLLEADGVYLTNALMGCLQAASLDGAALAAGPPPPDPGQLFAPVR